MHLWKSRGILFGGLLLFSCVGQAAQFVVESLDPAGFGFEDTTPVAPVGGNDGTTLGQQRLNVLQRAGEIWAAYLFSAVPIRVEALFTDLGGAPGGYALAGASAIDLEIGFANAPLSNVLYPVALANSLAGVDLEPTANDIYVQINIAPDTDPALPSWYYGFDGNTPANRTDLLDVLLHEIGHGLGFFSLVDLSNGSFFLNTFDVYSLNLFDTEAGLAWGDMRNNQRKNSLKNDPFLVWTGPYTTASSRKQLNLVRAIAVTTPPSVFGEILYEPAGFGPAVPAAGVSGLLVPVDDGTAPVTDACEPIQNTAELAGSIAYIDRGTCLFSEKVLNAQQNGAIAVIVANNVTGGPVAMGGDDIVNGIPITIPSVSVSLEDGQALLAQSPGVELTIGVPSTAGLAGTNGGFVRMYAPDPAEDGSSVSHFSASADPNLLMEPAINAGLPEHLDLSLPLLKDIGWVVINIPVPYLTYDFWVDETFTPSASLTAQGDDPDGDGVLNVEEYFFNGDPEVPDRDTLPRMELVGANPEVVYTRTKLATDLEYAYEISTDLENWTDAEEGTDYLLEDVTDLGYQAEQVRLTLVAPASNSRIMVRLRVVAL
jgi:hypothetical protein